MISAYRVLFPVALVIEILMGGPLEAAEMEYPEKVKATMSALQQKLSMLGDPKIEGTSTVAGKTVPVIYFGPHPINGKVDIVDEVQKEKGATATVFVKAGEEYVRVSTNVVKSDGTRAMGTQLEHNPAYQAISEGHPFYGRVGILGKPYDTAYEPIKDASGNTIGIYYVGYALSLSEPVKDW